MRVFSQVYFPQEQKISKQEQYIRARAICLLYHLHSSYNDEDIDIRKQYACLWKTATTMPCWTCMGILPHTKGDVNCQFYALQDQLETVCERQVNFMDLRRTAVSWIRDHIDDKIPSPGLE